LRQRMLHALEAMSRQLVIRRRCAEAVEAAMMAVSAEPLRESAQRALIEAHLAEGNWVEGRRTFEAYRDVLNRELGTQPDPEFAALVRWPAEQSRRPGAIHAEPFVTASSRQGFTPAPEAI
jgi:DNA-binding SARP family transcriptional activator